VTQFVKEVQDLVGDNETRGSTRENELLLEELILDFRSLSCLQVDNPSVRSLYL